MAEEKVRKTTAKKAVRRTTTKVAPRKTPVRKTAATSTAATTTATSVRKAPSRTVAAPVAHKKSKKKLIGVMVFLLVVLGASVGIGFSDKGQIDVTGVIATRKQNATPEEKQAFETVPVQQTTNVVNGGLVGSSDQSAPQAPAQEVLPTSTSTEPVATSTEATAEEGESPSETPTEEGTVSETSQ